MPARHGDRVHIANQAQLVNVIAPIRTEENGPAWRQAIFWPFARMAALARGRILQASVVSDRVQTAQYGDADIVDVSATWDEENSRVALFLANRSLDDAAGVEIALHGFRADRILRAEVLEAPDGADRHISNTADNERVGLRGRAGAAISESGVMLALPALSWAVVEVAVTVV